MLKEIPEWKLKARNTTFQVKLGLNFLSFWVQNISKKIKYF